MGVNRGEAAYPGLEAEVTPHMIEHVVTTLNDLGAGAKEAPVAVDPAS